MVGHETWQDEGVVGTLVGTLVRMDVAQGVEEEVADQLHLVADCLHRFVLVPVGCLQ